MHRSIMSGTARYHKSSKNRCCLCHGPGETQKLFNGCQHESACKKCLRDRYICQARTMQQYPLRCFGCQRLLQDAQIKRLAVSQSEVQAFRYFNSIVKSNKAIIKLNRKRFGEDWKGLLEVAKALDGMEIGRCPSCSMFIIKNGGCNHMECFCGASFYWKEDALQKDSQGLLLPILPKIDDVKKFPPITTPKTGSTIPTLRVDDDIEDATFSDYSAFSDDHEEEEEEYLDHQQEQTLSELPLDVESETHCSLDVSSPTTARDVHEKDSWENDFSIFDVESIESWDTHQGQSSMMMMEQASHQSSCSWEEVSEVSSVHSFHSKTGLSFLEVARSNGNSWQIQGKEPLPTIAESFASSSNGLTSRRKSSKSQAQQEEEEDDNSELFDAAFFWEGVKGSRGGKGKFRFGKENIRRYRHCYHQPRWFYDGRRRGQVYPKYMN